MRPISLDEGSDKMKHAQPDMLRELKELLLRRENTALSNGFQLDTYGEFLNRPLFLLRSKQVHTQ